MNTSHCELSLRAVFAKRSHPYRLEIALSAEEGSRPFGLVDHPCLHLFGEDVTRRAAIQALQPDVFLKSTDAGERVVGLAILEEFTNASYFEQVLDRITNSGSAFEQYRALRVIEGMLPPLGSNQRKRLKVALEDQMSGGEVKWIRPGTDRWEIASRIFDAIR